jgi:hypothetical protein
MRMHLLHGSLVLAVVGLTGCGGSPAIVASDTPPEEEIARLGDKTDVNLSDWLKQPRPELARRVAEWTDTVQKQRLHARENPLSVDLLPALQPPATMPVFREAAYSKKAGFSLPPYVKAGDADAALALHLARLGDRDAALRVGDPADKDLLNGIDARRTDHDYPVEWTQLTALAFQSAEWKLATGDPQGATDLVQMHQQLRALLDDKTAAGPLGAALLPRGRHALAEAVAAWKKSGVNKPGLAEDAEAALKAWGESPPPALALAPGAGQADVVRLFRRPANGQTVAAAEPMAVQRALDLLELPVPGEGVQAVVAFFDADKRLTETLVLYRANIIQTYPEPVNLAYGLVDHALPGDNPVKGVGLTRRTYSGDGLKYEAALFSRGDALGGYIRIAGDKAAPTGNLPLDARDFGVVHLDQTFEQNRVQFARDRIGPIVERDLRKSSSAVRLPIVNLAPSRAAIQREKDQNLTSSFAISWPLDEMPTAATKLAVPLAGAYGSPRIDCVADPDGDYLAFVWEDARTRLTLRLPYESNAPMLTAENRPSPDGADARAAEAFDQARRKARWEAGKPLRWLPRSRELPEIQLGMTKKQVLDNLPRKASIIQQNLGGDLSLLFRDAPAPEATFFVRQMFLRFAPDDRLAEIRVRYQEGPARPDEHHPSLLAALKKSGGEPQSLPAPWAGLWADLPMREPKAALYRWADDATLLTCQRDGGGAEVLLRDWPADATAEQAAEALPPLRFCDEGAAGVLLGQARADVLKKFPNHKPLENEDAVALAPSADSPYETLAVWFDADKVTRVAAQHKARPRDAADVTAKMQEAWTRDFDRLGALRRQDGAAGSILQAYGWHDDRVRVRLLAQETGDGPRLFTEWRTWPVAAKR